MHWKSLTLLIVFICKKNLKACHLTAIFKFENKFYDYKNLMELTLLKPFRLNLLVIQYQLTMRKEPTYGTQGRLCDSEKKQSNLKILFMSLFTFVR